MRARTHAQVGACDASQLRISHPPSHSSMPAADVAARRASANYACRQARFRAARLPRASAPAPCTDPGLQVRRGATISLTSVSSSPPGCACAPCAPSRRRRRTRCLRAGPSPPASARATPEPADRGAELVSARVSPIQTDANCVTRASVTRLNALARAPHASRKTRETSETWMHHTLAAA